ncbi:MAG: T9SS type A sorting domain-containing protein [Chitinophagaceae bacterium]|nr:T9SS type A sorting domain-containing protein [Chitinophagaceae bacterium]
MKSKKLLFSALVCLGSVTTYIVFSSSANASQGVMGASTIGCGSCHGSANAATSIAITGIPAGGYVAGTTYSLTLKITNATKLAAGFDLSVTGGTLSNAPANTMLMGGTELHHTAPLTIVAGDATWNFSWTAPATSSVTFNVAGNAVNNNNSDSGDQWSKITIDYVKAIPNAVKDVEQTISNLYPNPCTDHLNIEAQGAVNLTSVFATDINGRKTLLSGTKVNAGTYSFDTHHLSAGHYVLSFLSDGHIQHKQFTKKD